MTVTRAHKVNPNISFEVFIHKVDGLSDDHKIGQSRYLRPFAASSTDLCLQTETQREIHLRIMDELADAGLDNIHISFYLTSIYDHSIYEAFSKVIQKLIPQLPTLENLLNILCSVRVGIRNLYMRAADSCLAEFRNRKSLPFRHHIKDIHSDRLITSRHAIL